MVFSKSQQILKCLYIYFIVEHNKYCWLLFRSKHLYILVTCLQNWCNLCVRRCWVCSRLPSHWKHTWQHQQVSTAQNNSSIICAKLFGIWKDQIM